METYKRLPREVEYALMSAAAAALVSFIMIATFLELFSWLFIPAVSIMVFISAYFAFRRQMRGKSALNRRRIIRLASEVGTVSHFYTFALFFPLDYLLSDYQNGLDSELVLMYLASIFIMGLISNIFFVWIAVPMYIGIGYIQKSIEKDLPVDQLVDGEIPLDKVIEADT